MNYEKELMELVPMLRAYIRKTRRKFGYIDEDDVVQECLMKAFTSAKKTQVRNPRSFFIGVFNHTIIDMNRRAIKTQQRSERWALETIRRMEPAEERNCRRILDSIEMTVAGHRPVTRRVWAGLKRTHGHQSRTAKTIGVGLTTVRTEKKRLEVIYNSVSK